MQTPEAAIDEPQSFLHRAVRWLAILAIGYGVLQCMTLLVFAAAGDFPYRGWQMPRLLANGIALLQAAMPVLLVVGGSGLLKWKAWGRKLVITWSLLHVISGLVNTVTWIAFIAREWGSLSAAERAGRQYVGLNIWYSFSNWLEGCALPVAVLWLLLQPEVKRLWAHPSRSGGFDVIPMAGVATPAAAPPEVVS